MHRRPRVDRKALPPGPAQAEARMLKPLTLAVLVRTLVLLLVAMMALTTHCVEP